MLQLRPDVQKGPGRNALHIAAWSVPVKALGSRMHRGVVGILIEEAGSASGYVGRLVWVSGWVCEAGSVGV